MRILFDSAALPVAERMEAWISATGASLAPTEIFSPEPSAFSARLSAMPLGPAQATALAYTSLTCRRTARTIRASDPELYNVGFIRSGQQGIDQHHRSTVLGPGDLVIYDSSTPFEATSSNGMSPAESVVLQFPKRLLPLPAAQVTRMCANAIPGASGVGRLLSQFMVTLTGLSGQGTERDALRLGNTAIALTTAVLAHHLERDHAPAYSPSHVLYLRVLAFIGQHLHRPDLHPAAIAAAHRISLRYLHRIFQLHHHTSVGEHIRACRMDHARRDLIDPRFDHLTIASIGARWGFARPADFSRAFHHHVGTSPRRYRSTAMQLHVAEQGAGDGARLVTVGPVSRPDSTAMRSRSPSRSVT
jgi:AraC-like DNA-binding protein